MTCTQLPIEIDRDIVERARQSLHNRYSEQYAHADDGSKRRQPIVLLLQIPEIDEVLKSFKEVRYSAANRPDECAN